MRSIMGLSVLPINESGLFFDHQGTLLLRRGTWETKYHSGIYPKYDFHALSNIENNLLLAFENINNTDSKLKQIKSLLQQDCSQALHMIQEVSITRFRRSSGVFGILKDFIFGGDSIDEQLALFRLSEDEKMSHISDSLNKANQKHAELTNEVQERIKKINDGIINLKQRFSETKNNVLSKFIEETIMVANLLVQGIINKYIEIKINPINMEEEAIIIKKIEKVIPVGNIVLGSPTIKERKMVNDEIVMIIHNIIVSAKNYELFKIIPIPNEITHTIFNITDNTVAVNEHNYLYPKEVTRINTTHLISPDISIQRELDCVASAFFHESTNQSCLSKIINIPYTEFVELKNPNNILYYTSEPNKIYLNCNGTLTNPSQHAGIIILTQDCRIQTKHQEIHATLEVKDELFHTFFKPTPDVSTNKQEKNIQPDKTLWYYCLGIAISCNIILIGVIIIIVMREKPIIPKPPPIPSTIDSEL